MQETHAAGIASISEDAPFFMGDGHLDPKAPPSHKMSKSTGTEHPPMMPPMHPPPQLPPSDVVVGGGGLAEEVEAAGLAEDDDASHCAPLR